MRTITVSQTAAGSSATIPLDTYANPFNIGIGVAVTGTVDYTIQHTFDNVQDAAVTPTWYNHSSLAALTVNADGNYAFPVSAVKILVNSGAGTATAKIIQAGMPGK